MTSAFLIGGTGLVGGNILSTLISLPNIETTHNLSRRAPKNTSPSLHPIIEADSAKWPATLSAIQPIPSVFFSALGTTRAQAGSFEKQRLIDYDLNLAVAKAAKAAGIKVYVLISSAGVSHSSPFAYGKMKAELEEAVVELGFDHTVIVKPGLIVGTREGSRPPEAMLRGIANILGGVSGGWLKNSWAQDADIIARAAVNAGLKCVNGELKDKVVFLEQADVVRMGKKEWKA